MNIKTLYRKRIIPSECIHLKDDIIVEQNEECLITKWETLNPKTEFSHGSSCYFLQEGIKVSKMYRQDGSLTVTDLLADVIVYPDGRMEVVDLDELAEAMERDLITKKQMSSCLRSLNHLLSVIYRGNFNRLLSCLDRLGL